MEENGGEKKLSAVSAIKIVCVVLGIIFMGACLICYFSVGRFDSDHQAEPLNMIIDQYYDQYLNWYAEDYEAADEAEKHEAATAALLYAMLCSGNNLLSEGDVYTEEEIKEGARYADEHPEDVKMLADSVFGQAEYADMTMKELMDRNFALEPQEAYEGDIDLLEYTKYMDYTGAMFLEAEKYEQENIMIAYILYVRKYRMGEEISEEYAAQLAEEIHHPGTEREDTQITVETLQKLIEMNPERTIRELSNSDMDFSPQ